MKKIMAALLSAVLVMGMLPITSLPAAAYTSGDFTYSFNGEDTVWITRYTGSGGDVVIPPTLDGYRVTAIGKYYAGSVYGSAFCDCEDVTSVQIPEGVTLIGNGSFANCTGLTEVYLPDSVTIINDLAFSGCENLDTVRIGDNVTEIGFAAFSHCKLSNITIGDHVTGISTYAFDDTGYYSNQQNWATGVLYIGNHLFDSRSDITSCDIRYGTTTIQPDAFYDHDQLASVTIPDTVFEIGYRAFDGTALTKVDIPGSVKTIADSAFAGCESLTSVTLGDGVTEIGEGAFAYTGLTTVNIPSSVQVIGDDAFYCHDLESFTVDQGSAYFSTDVNGILFNQEQTELIQCPAAKNGSYLMPKTVKTIRRRAFYYCSGVYDVTFPEGLQTIGEEAFANTFLETVDIPASVTEIGFAAFDECGHITAFTVDPANSVYSDLDGVLFDKDQKTLIQYPLAKGEEYTVPNGVTKIGDRAFSHSRDMRGLLAIHFSDTVTEIGNQAFAHCLRMKELTLPGNIKTIGTEAFEACDNLNTVVLGEGMIEVGERAFASCLKLASVTFPNSLRTIGYDAFSGCWVLTAANLGTGITEIGTGAFLGCTQLSSVTIPNYTTGFGQIAFSNCADNLVLRGYAGSSTEKYAQNNSITFEALPQLSDNTTGVVVHGTEQALPTGAKLVARMTASSATSTTYDISLTKDGQTVQPTGEVTVQLPVPESMSGQKISVYRVESDGAKTDMNAQVKDGYAVFTTDHFSQYLLEVEQTAILGDINGSGKVDVTDALAILHMAVGLEQATPNADMDGSGGVTVADALAALRIAVGLA